MSDRITIRIGKDVREHLEVIGRKNKKDLSHVVRQALAEYLRNNMKGDSALL